MTEVTVRVLASGRVQGVYYRASTCEQATALGLRGWVRNLPDGRVEAQLSGPAQTVDKMLAWMQQGPPAANVDNIDSRPDDSPVPEGFEIR